VLFFRSVTQVTPAIADSLDEVPNEAARLHHAARRRGRHATTAHAQRHPMPVIGLLSGTDRQASPLDAIWQGLNEAGYVEGRNIAMEYQTRSSLVWYPALTGRAAAATATIPIVFSIGGAPVQRQSAPSTLTIIRNVGGILFHGRSMPLRNQAFPHAGSDYPHIRLVGGHQGSLARLRQSLPR
jgi:hypothetical protein